MPEESSKPAESSEESKSDDPEEAISTISSKDFGPEQGQDSPKTSDSLWLFSAIGAIIAFLLIALILMKNRQKDILE